MKKLFAKLFAHTPSAKKIDWKNIRSVLIRPIGTGLGDSVVLSAAFKQLKKAYPNCKLGILSTPRNRSILKHIPFVDEILPNNLLTAITHRKKYQILIDYQSSFTSKTILFNFFLAPSYTICFEKKTKKHYNADTVKNYNFYVPDLSAAHLSKSLALTPFAPHINAQTPSYTLTNPSPEALARVKAFFQPNVPNILVCPFGTDRQVDKTLLSEMLNKLHQHTHCHFILPFLPEAYPLEGSFTYTGKQDLEAFLALLKQVDMCLSVDSAPVHIACAYQTPLVGFYSGDNYNFKLFSPIGNHSTAVRSHTSANGPVKVIDNWSVDEAFEKAVRLLEARKK